MLTKLSAEFWSDKREKYLYFIRIYSTFLKWFVGSAFYFCIFTGQVIIYYFESFNFLMLKRTVLCTCSFTCPSSHRSTAALGGGDSRQHVHSERQTSEWGRHPQEICPAVDKDCCRASHGTVGPRCHYAEGEFSWLIVISKLLKPHSEGAVQRLRVGQ